MKIGSTTEDSLDNEKEEMIFALKPKKSQEKLIESGHIKFGNNQHRLDDLMRCIQKDATEGVILENDDNEAWKR